jgi:hypothetical protein
LNVTQVGSKVTAPVVLAGIELVAASPPPGGVPYLGKFATPFGSPFSFNPAGSNFGQATVSVSNGAILQADVILGPGGIVIGGGGTITGNVGNYGGAFKPGSSPGEFTIEGTYHQIGGTLEIEVASDTVFDVVHVLGPAMLEVANVNFKFINGFSPTAGFAFNFLDADTELVEDTTFSFSGLEPGFDFDVMPGIDGGLVFTALTDGVFVPEPASVLLCILAAGPWLARQRRRRECSQSE